MPDMNPELRRECVAIIKRMAKVRTPNYEFPPDSFLDACILNIYGKIKNNNMNWKIEVIFIGDYKALFFENEQAEKEDSCYRFALAIEKIIDETKSIPCTGDWIEPLAKPDYSLDIGKIAGRTFYTEKQVIQFEIE